MQFHMKLLTRADVTLHIAARACGFKTKAADFEAASSHSPKDKARAQILLRMGNKLDRLLEHFDNVL